MLKQKYVVGFMFSPDKKNVVLIRKNKPDWQKGKLNGVGGKVEEGETFTSAMVREFQEETGVETTLSDWEYFASLTLKTTEVYFFSSISDKWKLCRNTTEEFVQLIKVEDLLRNESVLPNLKVLIPLALDDSGIIKPVNLFDYKGR